MAVGAVPELTQKGAIMGTMPYMSPEQWHGANIDHLTDIWAVGIILFKMVTGQHPLHPRRGQELMVTGLMSEPMPRVASVSPALPDELASIIDLCLVKEAARRMPSAVALVDRLEPLLPGRYSRKLRLHAHPYPGLSAFQETDADRFFGRTSEVAAAATRLRDQPMLGIVGPSGVGKSSFVRAGLVPALKHSGEPWTALVVRPGRAPMSALAHALAPIAAAAPGRASTDGAHTAPEAFLEHPFEHQAIAQRLYREPGWMGSLLRNHAHHRGHQLLLFIDQFEELYTLGSDSPERLAFTACLSSVADDATTPLRVVLSIRADFLDRVNEDAYFMAELTRSLFFLPPPSRDGLREAIVEPAHMAGFRFESPSLVEHMLDHLQHTPGALPLLQFAASKLWDLRDQKHHLLTEASYRAIGGIAGALASHADAVIAGLPSAHHTLVRSLFVRLVTPERTRAVVAVEELCELSQEPAEVQRLIDHLVHARLLLVQSGGDEEDRRHASVEIVHESLIQSWPRLRRWLDETHDDTLFLQQLRHAAKQWQAKNYHRDLLWRGEAMEEARHWHRRYQGSLPELQQAYLAAVFAQADRSARRRRLFVIGALVALTLLVAAATVAALTIRSAQQQAVVEARAASRAEAEVRAQLAQVQAEKAARAAAEVRERAARQEAEAANERVARSNDELAQRNRDLNTALSRAEESRQRARQARLSAEGNAKAARRAEDAAQRANAELERLLASERERVRELQRQSGTIIENLNREDLVQRASDE